MRSGCSPAVRPRQVPAWCSTTAGSWPETAHPATPGPTAIPWPPSACIPTGASITSSPPGRGAMASDTRSAVRCLASARPTRTRYLTTTGSSRSFATELGRSGQALADEGEGELGKAVPGGSGDVTQGSPAGEHGQSVHGGPDRVLDALPALRLEHARLDQFVD